MTIVELKLKDIDNQLNKLKQIPNYTDFVRLIEKVEINHMNIHTEESRNILRLVLKQFIQTYIDTMYIMPDFAKICFKYVAMFKDPTQIIQYLERHKLDQNVEYYKQLLLFYHYSLKDNQLTQECIQKARQRFPNDRKLQDLIYTIQQNDVRYTHQTIYNQQSNNSLSLTYLSVDEIRLSDVTNQKIEEHKKLIINDSINLKPYQLMGFDRYILYQMMKLLNPRNDITVYYEVHSQLHRTYLTNYILQTIDQCQISYLEYVKQLPEINSQSVIQLQGQKISFQSQISFQTIKLVKLLGQGGFGAVFYGKLYKNKKVYDIAVKFFTREKDNILLNQISISGSFLRELYALACLTDRYRKIQEKGLKQKFYFTKLYCGLLSLQGNGAIIMEYVNGRNMYQLSKEQQFSKQQIFKFSIQMIMDIIHSDLKIDNFILQNNILYLCDFGKSVDLRLFLLNNKNLNSVSPSINCDPIYLFNCDYAGLAHCLYTMATQKILNMEDIKVYRDRQGQKCVQCEKMKRTHSSLNYLFEQLINYRCDGDYQTAKMQSDQKLQQLIEYCQHQIK